MWFKIRHVATGKIGMKPKSKWGDRKVMQQTDPSLSESSRLFMLSHKIQFIIAMKTFNDPVKWQPLLGRVVAIPI